MSFAEQRAEILERIARACAAAGRDPASVRLLAASKTRSAEEVRAAIATGHLLFGENRAQELRDKSQALLGHRPTPEWHFIGALQRNKVRYVVGTAVLVHAVDSLKLGEAISERAALLADRGELAGPVGVLVSVNVGDEDSKSGVAPSETLGLAAALHQLPHIEVRGLMCIPPAVDDPAESAPYFALLQSLAAEGRAAGLPLAELSMGMSHDFEVAIRFGATLVRVGTALFGGRS